MEVDVAGLELKLCLSIRGIRTFLVLRDKTEVCLSGCGHASGSQLTRACLRHDPSTTRYETSIGIEDDNELQVDTAAGTASVVVCNSNDYGINARSRVGM